MNKRFHLCTVVYEGEVRTVRDNSLIGEKSLSSQEVVDLLNTLDEQHRLMKEVLQEKIDENEQLKNDCGVLVQSNQDYRKENEQLKKEIEELKWNLELE